MANVNGTSRGKRTKVAHQAVPHVAEGVADHTHGADSHAQMVLIKNKEDVKGRDLTADEERLLQAYRIADAKSREHLVRFAEIFTKDFRNKKPSLRVISGGRM